MINGETKTGFKFEIDPDIVRDMEFIEIVAEAQGNMLKTPVMVTALLGADQRKRLYDHVRTEAGRVLYEDIDREVTEILDIVNSHKDTKN